MQRQTSINNDSGRRIAYAAFVAALTFGLAFPAIAGDESWEEEPDDRLRGEERQLVAGLIRRGMPELIEELLFGRPSMHRIYIARAYAKAGIDAQSPPQKEAFFEKAAEEYRRVIKLGRDPSWLRGERRRFRVTQWRVELASMMLRYWIAPDLDRYEITSGLDFDRLRVQTMLTEANEIYAAAGRELKGQGRA